jgi:hypothetical protein
MTIMIYIPIRATTVENTAALLLRSNLAQTLLKSIVFGGTAKSPPNDVR